MRQVFEAAWKSFVLFRDNHTDLVELEDKKEQFVNECCDLYKGFVNKHMKKTTNNNDKLKLDRHKIGAIVAIVGSRDYFSSINTVNSDVFFVGKYTIPINVGLQIILDDINRDLKDFGFFSKKRKSIEIYIPQAKVCTTSYDVVLARTLYYEEENKVDDVLRVLELANVFFLIEECTLLSESVHMQKWLDFKREQINIEY